MNEEGRTEGRKKGYHGRNKGRTQKKEGTKEGRKEQRKEGYHGRSKGKKERTKEGRNK